MNCFKCKVDLRGIDSIKNRLNDKEYCRMCYYKYVLGSKLPKCLNDSFTTNV